MINSRVDEILKASVEPYKINSIFAHNLDYSVMAFDRKKPSVEDFTVLEIVGTIYANGYDYFTAETVYRVLMMDNEAVLKEDSEQECKIIKSLENLENTAILLNYKIDNPNIELVERARLLHYERAVYCDEDGNYTQWFILLAEPILSTLAILRDTAKVLPFPNTEQR